MNSAKGIVEIIITWMIFGRLEPTHYRLLNDLWIFLSYRFVKSDTIYQSISSLSFWSDCIEDQAQRNLREEGIAGFVSAARRGVVSLEVSV